MKNLYIFLGVMFSVLLTACTREVDLPIAEASGDFLVIDAMLTDELKNHQIVLFNLSAGETETVPAVGATVSVTTESSVISFTESEAGVYISDKAFQLNDQNTYQLEITTPSGERYTSTQETLPGSAVIDRVYAIRESNDAGIEGVSIYLDATDPQNEATYFQYTFDETFVVEPPFFTPDNAIVINGDYPFCEVGIAKDDRPDSKRRCYRTEESNTLNLLSLESASQSSVRRHLVRFISRDDYKISHRYSIDAQQNVITEAAHDYFEVLGSFVSETNVFSQVQPGFVSSNIADEAGNSNTVIGFFTLARSQSQRIFFNYDDFFPGEPLPPFIDECLLRAPGRFLVDSHKVDLCGPLIRDIQNETLLFLRLNGGEIDCSNPPCPFIMVPKICGDCEVLGVSEPPLFWED